MTSSEHDYFIVLTQYFENFLGVRSNCETCLDYISPREFDGDFDITRLGWVIVTMDQGFIQIKNYGFGDSFSLRREVDLLPQYFILIRLCIVLHINYTLNRLQKVVIKCPPLLTFIFNTSFELILLLAISDKIFTLIFGITSFRFKVVDLFQQIIYIIQLFEPWNFLFGSPLLIFG